MEVSDISTKNKQKLWFVLLILLVLIDIYGINKPKNTYIFFMWFSELTIFFTINVVLIVFLTISFFLWFIPRYRLLRKIIGILVTITAIFSVLLFILWITVFNPTRIYTLVDQNAHITLKVVTFNDFLDDEIIVFRNKYLLVYKKTDDITYRKGTSLKEDRKELKAHNYRFDISRGTLILGNNSVYKIQ
jgi:hypothetical protein